MALGLDQIMSLAGTLTPEGIMSALQAQDAKHQEEMAQQAREAAGQAQQAGQDYTQAAGAPGPEAARENFIPTLLSNLASVIGGNPDYSREAHQVGRQHEADLMKARQDNLQSLQEIYSQKAKAAEHLGNLAEAEKARQSHERISTQLQKMRDEDAQRRALELEGVRGKNQLAVEGLRQKGETERQAMKDKAAAEKAKLDIEDFLSQQVVTTRAGNKWIDLTNVAKDKESQRAARAYAAKNKLVVADKGTADRLRAGEEVFSNFDEIEQVMRGFLPATPQGRILGAPLNVIAQATQSNDAIASFGNTQLAAIRNIQALASGIGSGFRLNEQEIKRAIANFPKITDDFPTAIRKLNWERSFLKNKERTFMKQDWRTAETPKQTAAPTEAHAGDPLGIR